jgi:uncharacterized protein YlxW (UPF0749 family)
MNSNHLMVVIIVAIVMIASVVRAVVSGGHRRRDRAVDPADEIEKQRLRDEVKQLRERLAVIERITVEKEGSLEREIERLRDR